MIRPALRSIVSRVALPMLATLILASCDAASRATAPAVAAAPLLNVGSGKPYRLLLRTADAPAGLVSAASAQLTVNQGSGTICYQLSATMADPSVDFAWHSVVALDVNGVRKYLANEPLMIGPLVNGAAPHVAAGCTSAGPELTGEHLRKLARSDARLTAGFTTGNQSMSYLTGTMTGVLER